MSEATATRTTEGSITLTPAASAHVRKLLAKQENPNLVLRLGVMGGGCSGFQYVIRLEEESEIDPQFDRVFESDGVRAVVDKKSLIYLNGMELDFDTGDLMAGGGFQFNNPNAKRGCGCGTSFQA